MRLSSSSVMRSRSFQETHTETKNIKLTSFLCTSTFSFSPVSFFMHAGPQFGRCSLFLLVVFRLSHFSLSPFFSLHLCKHRGLSLFRTRNKVEVAAFNFLSFFPLFQPTNFAPREGTGEETRKRVRITLCTPTTKLKQTTQKPDTHKDTVSVRLLTHAAPPASSR